MENKHSPGRAGTQQAIYILIILLGVSSICFSFLDGVKTPDRAIEHDSSALGKDSIASKEAFLQAYTVLLSPRCMNCHPSGNIPLQGNDSHLHTQGVTRGPDGRGMYAMKCANCHQPENTPGIHMPPGGPDWALPPAGMKMVFQGRTPRQLARQLLNPSQNGGRTRGQLIRHITSNKLVLWAWNPGAGRTLPPLSHEVFAKEFTRWIDLGAYLPDK
ncbi:MAG TPA: hypothetical protein VNE41_06260 [Chitinophagaceae bacterium]|nr:hypothetical protein [Chitinophagaceae bacterium]